MNATIFRSLESARGQFGPCALAIGNFDGVHIGHQALLRQTIAAALPNKLAAGVMTFDPHPAAIVAPGRVPPLITTLEEKLRLVTAIGIERVLVLPFTEQVAQIPPKEFVQEILITALDARVIIVGDNFRFGHGAAGTPKTLRALEQELGFISQFVAPVRYRGEIVSSSAVRHYLAGGNVSRAARLLGRCFAVEGPVVPGHGVGSRQTVPTLNLRPAPGQILPRGVYVTETVELPSGRRWQSITNVGVRPTFQGDELTIESFLLSPFEGEAPKNIRVEFRRFVRPERQFPDAGALKAQILRDAAVAKIYWRRVAKLLHAAPSLS